MVPISWATLYMFANVYVSQLHMLVSLPEAARSQREHYLSPRFIVSAVPIIDTASNMLLQIFAACKHNATVN